MRISCDSTYDKFKNFYSFENLIHFSIDSQLNLEKKCIPKVDLQQERIRLRLNLEEGFNEAAIKQKLITNYDKYRNHYQNDENIKMLYIISQPLFGE